MTTAKQSRFKTALLLGSYGQSNIGDDILMENFVSLLEHAGYSKIFTNVADENLVPSTIVNRVTTFQTYDTSLWKLLRIVLSSDIVIYGGGTIYKELYKSTSRLPYGVILRMAIFNIISWSLQKKVVNLNVGIGTLQSRFGNLLTKICLLTSEVTVFRDMSSYALARDVMDIPSRKIRLADDAIFLNGVWHDTTASNRISKTIGLNVLSDIPDAVDREQYIQTVIDYVCELQRDGYRFVFVPFQHEYNKNNDLNFFSEYILPHIDQSLVTVRQAVPLGDLVQLFQTFELFVGMRFHSLLLAASTATPFLAISYDPKCERLIQDMHYPHSVSLSRLSTKELLEAFVQLEINKDQITIQLIKQVADLYAKNAEAGDKLISLVK